MMSESGRIRATGVLAVIVLLVAACAPATPAAPTTAPAKPTAAASKPAAAASPAGAPSKPAAAASPASKPATAASPAAAKPAAPAKPSAALQKIIDGAKAEGKLNVAGPSSLGDASVKRIVEEMNKKYGTSIEVTWSGRGQAGPTIAQIITEISTGGKPTWDLFITNDGQKVKLFTADALQKVPYTELFGINPGAVGLGSTAVGFANQLVLPTYNTQLVAANDVPKTWEDLLDPKWKGKIGVSTSVHHLARLASVWGEDKVMDYGRKLGAQEPKLGQLNENFQRLTIGETLLSFTQTNSQVESGMKRGQPVQWALDVRPAIGTWYYCGANTNAEHSNAAILFCGFMADPVAFAIWAENQGKQSILDTSTQLGKIYQQGPQNVALADEKFMIEKLEPLEEKLTPILGYR